MSARRAAVTAVAAIAVSLGALTGVAVAAPSPSISVVPSTDLVDGQTVAVTGTGFSADVTAVTINQCWLSAPHCEGRAVAIASGGAFSAVITVSRFADIRDCLADQPAEPCEVVVWNLDGGAGLGSEFVFVTLSFVDVATVPGAPTILANATAANASATVSWTPGSTGGSSITGYVVTPYVGYFALPSTTFASTATTETVTGLTNGVTYRFRVQAVNAVGAGGYSKVTNPVTPSA